MFGRRVSYRLALYPSYTLKRSRDKALPYERLTVAKKTFKSTAKNSLRERPRD